MYTLENRFKELTAKYCKTHIFSGVMLALAMSSNWFLSLLCLAQWREIHDALVLFYFLLPSIVLVLFVVYLFALPKEKRAKIEEPPKTT